MTSFTVSCAQRVPLALKLSYGLATPLIAAVYARCYGPTNFLWLSDVALGLTTGAVITERALPASVAAVGVLPLEMAWNVEFVSGGRVTGLGGYLLGRQRPLG